MDTHLRSVVKGLSWRAVATAVTTVVVLFYYREFALAALVGLTDSVVKIGLCWAHERAWQRVRWGRCLPAVSA